MKIPVKQTSWASYIGVTRSQPIIVFYDKPKRIRRSQRSQRFAYWKNFHVNGEPVVGFSFTDRPPAAQRTYMIFTSYEEGNEYANEIFTAHGNKDPNFYAYTIVKR